MWDEVFGVALTNGIFACLFVALLIYELKDSRQREKKYQKTIETLTSRLVTIEKVHEDELLTGGISAGGDRSYCSGILAGRMGRRRHEYALLSVGRRRGCKGAGTVHPALYHHEASEREWLVCSHVRGGRLLRG